MSAADDDVEALARQTEEDLTERMAIEEAGADPTTNLPATDLEAIGNAIAGPSRRLTGRSAADVTIERPEWHWQGWIPAGVLSLIVGRQGAGKTTWAAYEIAALSTGRSLNGDHARPSMRCGILSLEEPDGRVVARLDAAGATRDRVVIFGMVQDVDDEGRVFERPWQLPRDCDVLAERIATDGLGLVDGLGYAIAGDSHNVQS